MSHDVFSKIEEAGSLFAERSEAADELGRLPDEICKRLKDSGLVRLLQPADFGGYEADPRDFLNAVMDVGNHCPSAGWVAGVVGVHPWELALNDERLQAEVWGADPDTWVASPYAPSGTAVLGAVIPGEGATPAGMLHIMLPRSDYEIVPDSWNVIGLAGTGSKDVIVRNAFVPDYRTIDVFKVLNGQAATEAGRRQPLYRMPWSTMFPCAVSAGVVGIAEGVLKHAVRRHFHVGLHDHRV